jgi:hypothetical protein
MTLQKLVEELSKPFDPADVKFRPGLVKGNRALALAYVDARTIQDRLDDVLGVDGWQDDYEALADGSVICRLRIRLGNEWLTKTDVGGQSEQPDDGDRMKAAFSDALKRAAVKFGIGRYLYRNPPQWVDWDPQRHQFVRPPALPRVPERKPALNGTAKAMKRPVNGKELLARLEAQGSPGSSVLATALAEVYVKVMPLAHLTLLPMTSERIQPLVGAVRQFLDQVSRDVAVPVPTFTDAEISNALRISSMQLSRGDGNAGAETGFYRQFRQQW